MKIKQLTKTTFAATLSGVIALVASTITSAAEVESAIAHGGQLYDKWYKVVGVDAPKESHKLYPGDKKYAKKSKSNWRCKECHGWDGLGKDGAYKSGKHSTGIVGINGAKGKPVADIIAVLKSSDHGYAGKMGEADFNDLALFVSQGQIDMSQYIDYASKKAKGDAAKGEAYYNTICAKCHGFDGKEPKDLEKPIGALVGNPQEFMHKLLNGQPKEQMPALRALDHQIIADIMAYAATMPKE